MNVIKNFKRVRSLLKDKFWRAKAAYPRYYEELPIDEKAILLESEHGKKVDGNIFYLLRYLANAPEYKDFKIYLSSMGRNMRKFSEFLSQRGIEGVQPVMLASDEYMRLLASAKYIINDTSFPPYYMKKEGQVYINTWHGTPLKTLGRRDNADFHAIGNVQKNFLAADYLLYPNEYMKEIMLRDYMLKNIAKGKTFLSGYPRNEIFFDKVAEAEIRRDLELEGKRVYAYMPTYRGSVSKGKTDVSSAYLVYHLAEIDKNLKDDEVFFVNLHPLAKDAINFSCFKNIRQFPREYEVYEFLNGVDVLITDYSSVFFDFAPSGKKIVLFPYDEEEYLAERGMYMDIRELPFPRVFGNRELLEEIRRPEKNYDDGEFLRTFCPYEGADASKRLCDQLILGKDMGISAEPIESNGKKNVLIYTGDLAANGITASIRSLLSYVDLSKYNYYITFVTEAVSRFRDTVREFPSEVGYIPFSGDMNMTVKDRVVRKLFKGKLISASKYCDICRTTLKNELIRKYEGARIDTLIQFNGYDYEVILNFSVFDGNSVIFVHNDMLKEAKTRGNQRIDILKYAYNAYDHVAIVTEDMRSSATRIAGKADRIEVVRNTINYKLVRERSELPVAYDDYTKATVPEERLKEILGSGARTFINIGRFSPEKGQDRLINAFAKYLKNECSDAYLLIIGGRSGPGYFEMLKGMSEELGISGRVILLERMSNPYSILKACDGFILSSRYEGFGLVLAEADMLGVPVASTDIEGPRLFMQKHGGSMVEDSEEGIYKGLCMLGNGEIKPMGVDYEAYNLEAVSEFEALLG